MDITINVYRNGDGWYYAMWLDGEHDHNGELDAETEAEAMREAETMPLRVTGERTIRRVADS